MTICQHIRYEQTVPLATNVKSPEVLKLNSKLQKDMGFIGLLVYF